jgi:hypothetical protein
MSVEFRLEDLEESDLKIERVKIYRGSSSGKASEGSDYGHVQGIHSITAPWERKLANKNIGQAAGMIEGDADAEKAKVSSVNATTSSVRAALERLINYKVDQLPGTDEDPGQNRSKGQRTAASVGWLDKFTVEKETYGVLVTPSKNIRRNATINFIGANYNIESTPDREDAINKFFTEWEEVPIVNSPTLKKELTERVVETYYPVKNNQKFIKERGKRLKEHEKKLTVHPLNLDSDNDSEG